MGDYPDALSSITGFPTPGTVENGSIYAADQGGAVAQQAQSDEIAAYDTLIGLTSTADESNVVLGTGGTVSTLLPGVYTFSGGTPSAQVDGTLTLNFDGESDAMFVFQIGSTLTTGSSASIVVEGGDSTDSIYWLVGSSATLGSSTTFAGNILAIDSITLDPSASIVCGRALAQTGSVTMASTNFISDNCGVANTPSGGYSSSGTSDFGSIGFSGGPAAGGAPEPGTIPLLSAGLLALILYGWQSRKRMA